MVAWLVIQYIGVGRMWVAYFWPRKEYFITALSFYAFSSDLKIVEVEEGKLLLILRVLSGSEERKGFECLKQQMFVELIFLLLFLCNFPPHCCFFSFIWSVLIVAVLQRFYSSEKCRRSQYLKLTVLGRTDLFKIFLYYKASFIWRAVLPNVGLEIKGTMRLYSINIMFTG